jgi:hypothetical protein
MRSRPWDRENGDVERACACACCSRMCVGVHMTSHRISSGVTSVRGPHLQQHGVAGALEWPGRIHGAVEGLEQQLGSFHLALALHLDIQHARYVLVA